jgi:hypothetical protein
MIGPELKRINTLCVSFVKALMRLSIEELNVLLFDTSPQIVVKWDMPYLFDLKVGPITETWFSFGIAVGISSN